MGQRAAPPSEEPRLRPATLGDLASIVALVDASYRGDTSRGGWTTEADLLDGQRTDSDEIAEILGDAQARLTLAEQSGAVVGSVLSRLQSDGAHIGMLAVHPSLQGRGLGRRLLAEAERIAAVELRAGSAILWVLSCRRELLAWYRRRGYRDTGHRQPFPYHDPRFGLPKVAGLEFAVLQKRL
jgi:ribosomal protein S18 acetylase RimI-like enzyme